jgi:hypothetical protein
MKRKINLFHPKNVLSLYLGEVRFFSFKNPAHIFDRENNML